MKLDDNGACFVTLTYGITRKWREVLDLRVFFFSAQEEKAVEICCSVLLFVETICFLIGPWDFSKLMVFMCRFLSTVSSARGSFRQNFVL